MDKAKLSKLFDMSGRVVIVTGGTRGIGRALAEGYAAAGAKVASLAATSIWLRIHLRKKYQW